LPRETRSLKYVELKNVEVIWLKRVQRKKIACVYDVIKMKRKTILHIQLGLFIKEKKFIAM
jgi:hypothetical protein